MIITIVPTRATFILAIIMTLFGCAYTFTFHNTADDELDALAKSLTNTMLEDLFRQHPSKRHIWLRHTN